MLKISRVKIKTIEYFPVNVFRAAYNWGFKDPLGKWLNGKPSSSFFCVVVLFKVCHTVPATEMDSPNP